MTRRTAQLLVSAPCILLVAAQTNPPSVSLSPGSNLQAAIDAAPPGTTFLLQAGVYRMQSLSPKNGDVFTGQGAVDLNGSQILTFAADPGGNGLWVATTLLLTSGAFPCLASSPLCDQIEDVFIDNVLQKPAAALNGLKPGWSYFDQSRRAVYLPANPAGHVVEIGAATGAFSGAASGVRISNLTVEKYATHAQQGAIGDVREGSAWIVNNVEVRWNHGAGVELGPGSTISNSYIHHNGQLGLSLSGANGQAIGNEISWNNYAGFDPGWEAGGAKFWATNNLLVQSNYVHDNQGPGLWTDTNNTGTLYQNNTVINNLNEGIKHEVSYSATIRNNIVKGNGNTSTTWLWNAQIELQNSSNAQVYGNTVEVPAGGGNGIALINQNRGSGTMGPWVTANDKVYNNTITYLGPGGASGIADDTGGNTAVGNSFDADRYILKTGSTSAVHWKWFSGMDWSAFQAAGEEKNGTCCN